MNKDRRKRITEINDAIEDLKAGLYSLAEEEREAYDNLPESIRDGEKGQRMAELADILDAAGNLLEDAQAELYEIEL